MAKGKGTYRVGFIALLALWVTMTAFCYYGVITFDSRGPEGAMLSGFIIAASILGMISALKVLYDPLWG